MSIFLEVKDGKVHAWLPAHLCGSEALSVSPLCWHGGWADMVGAWQSVHGSAGKDLAAVLSLFSISYVHPVLGRDPGRTIW